MWPRRKSRSEGLEGVAKEEGQEEVGGTGGCGQKRMDWRVRPRKKSWEGVAKEQKDGVTEEVCKKSTNY